jgi:hypothetical protein
MFDENGLIFLIVGGVLLVGGIAVGFKLLEKSLKTPAKPAPKPAPTPEVVMSAAPQKNEITPEIIVSAAPTVRVDTPANNNDKTAGGARGGTPRKRIADYHKDRWKNSNYELLSLDDATIYDQDDTEISEEDMKKILAFGDLFRDKK